MGPGEKTSDASITLTATEGLALLILVALPACLLIFFACDSAWEFVHGESVAETLPWVLEGLIDVSIGLAICSIFPWVRRIRAQNQDRRSKNRTPPP
jgi:hypothetical protein